MERRTIQQLVACHAPTEGVHDTAFEGVQLFRLSQPVKRVPGVYPPSICAIVQGAKHAYLSGEKHVYSASHYLCATMPLPVEAEVPEATQEEPVLGLLISLETRTMAELMVEYKTNAAPVRQRRSIEPVPGLAVAAWDDAFATALLRLLELLDEPLSLQVLGRGRLRELLFTVIQGEAGALIRRTFGESHDLARVLSYVRENLHEPLSVNDLARRAGMSRAVFDRRFKTATTFSPLKFIKGVSPKLTKRGEGPVEGPRHGRCRCV